jgi:hypothetical protein
MDVFVKVACHIAKGGLLNVIGREINSIKQVFELKAAQLTIICSKVMLFI